ncbi:FkbM family methyltransferase [Candidatus Woesearchaeota archaeon]|jgi:FkbM family methyltransferase|nr:FkbM family methyltransferase [Candidatus Woesearchaeota archaeon]
MNKINKTVELYKKKEIDKSDFIKNMYSKHHSKLYEYAEFLPKTDIEKITIENNRVITTSRKHGIKIECNSGDHRIAPIETLNFFDYEKDESDMIEKLIFFGDEKKSFFDIGANIGWYSIMAAKSNRNILVNSFEPIPKTFASLKGNVKLNALPNISIHNFGFSDKEGEFDFYYYPEGSGNASSANVTGRSDIEVVKCKVKTLDEYVDENNIQIDFIKCDVEGAELLVFKGGINAIKKNKPIIFSEILRKWSSKFNYHSNDIIELFKSVGYGCYFVIKGRLKEITTITDETIETNFFFLHQKKHSDLIDKFTK